MNCRVCESYINKALTKKPKKTKKQKVKNKNPKTKNKTLEQPNNKHSCALGAALG